MPVVRFPMLMLLIFTLMALQAGHAWAAGESGSNVLPLKSEFTPGEYGEPFEERGLFQGCDVVDGVEYCAFHLLGWKFYAYHGGPTGAVIMEGLEQVPVNTPVILRGDQISMGDLTVEIALREVERDPAGDQYVTVRNNMQGRWISLDDPKSEIEFMGSEKRNIYDGNFQGLDFLQIADSCGEFPEEAGPFLSSIDPSDREDGPQCFSILKADNKTLELGYMGRGNTLRYRRPNY